jgi:hypothetical protein
MYSVPSHYWDVMCSHVHIAEKFGVAVTFYACNLEGSCLVSGRDTSRPDLSYSWVSSVRIGNYVNYTEKYFHFLTYIGSVLVLLHFISHRPFLHFVFPVPNRLCGLVVRVPGYRSRSPVFDSRRYQIFWEVVGLERDPLRFVRIIEELLERKVAAPV